MYKLDPLSFGSLLTVVILLCLALFGIRAVRTLAPVLESPAMALEHAPE